MANKTSDAVCFAAFYGEIAFLRAMHSQAAEQLAHVALSRYMSKQADTRLEASFRLVSACFDMHRS